MKKDWLLFLMLFAVMLAGCGTSTTPRVVPSTLPPAADHIRLPNMLVSVNGQVVIRHPGSTEYTPATLGTKVEPGDTLRVLTGSAAIFCGDEALWDKSPFPLRPGRDLGVPCTLGRPPRPLPDLTLLRGKPSEVTQEIPYVIFPRTGWVLSDRPLIRWHPLAGVDTYTVTLKSDDGLKRPPAVVTGHELVYPSLWPPLQANGATYVVIVEGGGRRSDEAGVTGLGFSLLPPDRIQRLREQEARLRKRPLQDLDLALLLAELYRTYDLRSEVVALLTDTAGGENSVAVQLLLGQTYLNMHLFAEAENAFARALTLAQQKGLLESQADAHLGLGLALCGMKRGRGVRPHWQRAQKLYLHLGLTDRAEQVSGYLDQAASRCSSR